MRFAIAALLIVHGLLHLIGVFRPAKAFWIAAAIVFLLAGLLRALNRDEWWIAGALALVLSQALIILQWTDAKAGTIVNVLVASFVLVGFATARFHRENDRQVRALLERVPKQPASIVTQEELASLPPPVKRWLETSGVVGKPRARTVWLEQRGRLRPSATGPRMPARATQYFTLDDPAFIWMVDASMFGIPIVGRDTLRDGRGHMFIQAAGLITVADGLGEKFDQGTVLRFLAELCWIPSGALAPWVRWEPIDERSARATISVPNLTTSAIFEFDQQGRLSGLSAKRYFNGETLEDWFIPITEWKAFEGITVPSAGGAQWRLETGAFDYFQWEIIDLKTNLITST